MAADLGIWCNPAGGESLVISVNGSRSSLEPLLRDGLYSLDPDLAMYDVRPLTEITNSAFAPQQLLVVPGRTSVYSRELRAVPLREIDS
jgi:hypothetical protein